jgi:O-antigen/teichoic acid export membrane protein
MLSTVLLVRIFAPDDVGKYFLLGSLLAALGGFGLPGVSSALVSNVARSEGGTFRAAVRIEFVGGLVGACLLFPLLYINLSQECFGLWYALGAALLFPFFLNDCGVQALNGTRNYPGLSCLSVCSKLLSLAGLAACFVFSLSWISYALIGMLITSCLNTALVVYFWKHLPKQDVVDKSCLRYGLNLTLSNVLLQPAGQLERIVVGFWFGTEELAIYALGEMVFNYLKLAGNYTHSIYMPRLTEVPAERTGRWLSLHAGVWTGAAFVAALVLWLTFPHLYPLLFGEHYVESAKYGGWFALVFAFGMPNYFLTIYFRHLRDTRATYIYGLVRAPLQISTLALGLWLFGIVGLPIARGVCVFTHAIIGLAVAFGTPRRMLRNGQPGGVYQNGAEHE